MGKLLLSATMIACCAIPAHASYWDACGVYRDQYTEAPASSDADVTAEQSCDKISCSNPTAREICFNAVKDRVASEAEPGEAAESKGKRTDDMTHTGTYITPPELYRIMMCIKNVNADLGCWNHNGPGPFYHVQTCAY
jgi:hypothetical protein